MQRSKGTSIDLRNIKETQSETLLRSSAHTLKASLDIVPSDRPGHRSEHPGDPEVTQSLH